MSKKAKSAAALKRRKDKRARKDAMKAMYAAWTEDGQNKKSCRARQKAAKNRLVSNFKHQVQFCGNVGCEQCFPGMSHHVETRRVRALIEAARLAKVK